MTDEHSYRLDLLILARLATTTRQPPSVAKLEADLFAFVEARLSRREWSSLLVERLGTLRSSGAVDARRVPTSKGLERLRGALGVRELPARWSEIWRALLPALALALPGAQWSEVAGADKLRARIIRQEHRLSLPELPTLPQAVDAQIWQALGLPDLGPLTLGKLRRAVIERSLGASLRAKSINANDAGQWLASAALGTATRDITASQRALVGRWLVSGEKAVAGDDRKASPVREDATVQPTVGSPTAPAGSPKAPVGSPKASVYEPKAPVHSPKPPASEPLPLERWAEQVQALADTTRSGRYGDERVFIAAVWRAAQAGPAALHGPLPAFKTRLVEANRAGLLRLHRADLVGAMDEQLVSESETRHLNATFHFVETHSRRAS